MISIFPSNKLSVSRDSRRASFCFRVSWSFSICFWIVGEVRTAVYISSKLWFRVDPSFWMVDMTHEGERMTRETFCNDIDAHIVVEASPDTSERNPRYESISARSFGSIPRVSSCIIS